MIRSRELITLESFMYCKVQYKLCFEFIAILSTLPTDSCRGGVGRNAYCCFFQQGIFESLVQKGEKALEGVEGREGHTRKGGIDGDERRIFEENSANHSLVSPAIPLIQASIIYLHPRRLLCYYAPLIKISITCTFSFSPFLISWGLSWVFSFFGLDPKQPYLHLSSAPEVLLGLWPRSLTTSLKPWVSVSRCQPPVCFTAMHSLVQRSSLLLSCYCPPGFL